MSEAPEAASNALTGGYAPAAEPAAGGQAEPAPSPAPAEAPQPTEAPSWIGGLSEEQQSYVGNKAWQSPEDMLTSYQNLEKMRGVPADQLYTIKPDMEPADIEKVQMALGRPESIDGYEITEVQDAVPGSTDLVKQFAFENGLSPKAASGLYDKFNEFIVSTHQGHVEQVNATNKQSLDALHKEWGAGWDKNLNIAMRAAENLGISEEMQTAINGAGQSAQFIKALNKIGGLMAEGEVTGMSPEQAKASMGAMTPVEARSQIDKLRADPNFSARLTSGNGQTRQAAQAELDPLYEILAKR